MTLTESSRKGSALAQFRQIYRWQLKRSRLISILCLGLTFLCFSVVHLCKSVRSYHDYFDNPSELGENVSHAYLLKQHGERAMREAVKQRDRLLDQLARQAATLTDERRNARRLR